MIRSYSFQNSRAFPMASATFETTAQKTLGTLACSAIYDSFSWNASFATKNPSLSLHYSSGGVKTTFSTVMRTLLGPRSATILTPLRGAGGFTAGAAAPAVNMLEEALHFDAPNTKSAPTGYRRAPNIISHHYKQQLSAKASIVPKARPIRFR